MFLTQPIKSKLEMSVKKVILACVLFLTTYQAALATDPKPTSPSPSTSTQAASNAAANAAALSQSNAAAASTAHGGASNATAQGGTGGAATGGNANASGGSANQTQSAHGGNGGDGGVSTQSQSADNVGNEQNLSVTSNHKQVRQAPSISAPTVFASGPCAYGWSAGVSSPVGGISGGKAKADVNCDRREVARILLGVNPALALKVLCADPLVAAVASGDDCQYIPPATNVVTEPVTPKADTSKFVTREELNKVFKKSQSK